MPSSRHSHIATLAILVSGAFTANCLGFFGGATTVLAANEESAPQSAQHTSAKRGDPNVQPIAFTITDTRFIADGAEHGPTIVATPTGASFTVSGTAKATKPGSYMLSATGTGNYSGTVTCNWRIDPAGGAPVHAAQNAPQPAVSRQVDIEIHDATGKTVHHAVIKIFGNQAGRTWLSKPTDANRTEVIAFASGAATTVMYIVHTSSGAEDFSETRYGATFSGDSHQLKAGDNTVTVRVLPPAG